jgi:hypothetical protein
VAEIIALTRRFFIWALERFGIYIIIPLGELEKERGKDGLRIMATRLETM